MSETTLKTPKECRNAYRDILQGYCFVPEHEYYIKHFAEADLGLLESLYTSYKTEASNFGLSSKEEKLKFLEDEGYWTREEEDNYTNAKNAVYDAEEHMSKLVIPGQIEGFKQIVQDVKDKLLTVKKERDELVQPTVETFCDKRINEDYVYIAFFKDKELKEPYFTKEEFDELSYREMADLIKVYNIAINPFSELNIKRIAVNSFFLNAFLMCDNDPVKFYGKAVLELTIYQMNLFSRGKFCKSVLTEGEEPPEQFYRDDKHGVENLMNWYDNTYNVLIAKRESDNLQAKKQSSFAGNRAARPARKVRKAGRGGR